MDKFDLNKAEDREAAVFESTFGMFEKTGGAKRGEAIKRVSESYFEKQEKRERAEADRRDQ